jgi:hypothetical protein
MNLPVPADECVKILGTQLHAKLYDGESPYTDQNKTILIEHEDLISSFTALPAESIFHIFHIFTSLCKPFKLSNYKIPSTENPGAHGARPSPKAFCTLTGGFRSGWGS